MGLLLRQPLIVSFIAVGILTGPSGLDIVHSDERIDLLAKLGTALLLFLIGLKLDFTLARSLGPVALVTGLRKVLFTTVFGALIALALGFEPLTALYVAVALTFSSTIIVVKLLSDKREIEALHGRIALRFLIVQDVVVVVAMILLSAIGVGHAAQGAGAAGEVAAVLGYGAAMLAAVALFARYLAMPLVIRLSRARRNCWSPLPSAGPRFRLRWATISASARDSADCSPPSPWPPPRFAKPSPRACRACATSRCCSSSSRSEPRSISPCSATASARPSSCRCSC